ncbi:MAG: hypothetical protein Q4B14_04595 [Clostridia bacterium]|nr:hypothetical protein [Clostridia bacterium]
MKFINYDNLSYFSQKLKSMFAPISHSSSDCSLYGSSNQDNYGHVKLTDDYLSDSPDVLTNGVSTGIAPSAYALQASNSVLKNHLNYDLNDPKLVLYPDNNNIRYKMKNNIVNIHFTGELGEFSTNRYHVLATLEDKYAPPYDIYFTCFPAANASNAILCSINTNCILGLYNFSGEKIYSAYGSVTYIV